MRNERRGVQITRMLVMIRILERSSSVTIKDIRRKFKGAVCERTVRRDLMILLDLRWIEPIPGEGNETRWRWILEK